MSYFKYHNSVPTLSNFNSFFEQKYQITDDWLEFYSAIRDPSWPDCESYKEIYKLPEYIQNEIQKTYQSPNKLIMTESNLVEFLSETYYDMLTGCNHPNFFDVPVYCLSDYFSKKTQALEQIAKQMQWKYNYQYSDNFYSAMMKANQPHLLWLDNMKQIHNNVINSVHTLVNLQPWERALVIAKSCITIGLHPKVLNWQDTHCFLDNNTASLIKSLRG